MNTVSIINDLQVIAAMFESEFENFPGSDKVRKIRREAFNKFLELGFPLKNNEEYKYSSTEKLFKEELCWFSSIKNISKIDYQAYRDKNKDTNHIFLLNGELVWARGY